MLGLLQIDEPRLETTRLQFVGYHGEDGQHRRHTIVRRIEQSPKDNTKGQSQQLLHAVVHSSPEEALCRFLLQRFHRLSLLLWWTHADISAAKIMQIE